MIMMTLPTYSTSCKPIESGWCIRFVDVGQVYDPTRFNTCSTNLWNDKNSEIQAPSFCTPAQAHSPADLVRSISFSLSQYCPSQPVDPQTPATSGATFRFQSMAPSLPYRSSSQSFAFLKWPQSIWAASVSIQSEGPKEDVRSLCGRSTDWGAHSSAPNAW